MVAPKIFRICALGLFGAWILAWLLAFPNAYGWHFDDSVEFSTFYTAPLAVLARPPFFHAYAWLVAPIPIFLHDVFKLGIPSLAMGAISAPVTGYFRLVMLWTFLLQAVWLAATPFFLVRIIKHGVAALIAFAALLLSGPLNWWALDIDNRLLGMVATLPALWIVYRIASGEIDPSRVGRLARLAFFSGVLLAIGQSFHYTCLYLSIPWTCVCVLIALRTEFKRAAVLAIGVGAGVAASFAVFELDYRLVHLYTAYVDPVVFLFAQNSVHIANYGWSVKVGIWLAALETLMGIPMMLAVVAGMVVCFVPALRPAWLSRDAGFVFGGTALLAIAYLAITPAFGFYRQTSCLQLCFGALSGIAIARLAELVSLRWRTAVAAIAAVVMLWTSGTQAFANYQSNQGLGRALRVAAADPRIHKAYLYDWFASAGPDLTGPVKDSDGIITSFPRTILNDPNTLGMLHEIKPLGAFFAQQCTLEAYYEGAGLSVFRHFSNEPEMCEARVYLGADINRIHGAPLLAIKRVTTDSVRGMYTGARTFGSQGGSSQIAGWVSGSGPSHFLRLEFAGRERLSTVTVVPPDYIGAGDRIDNLSVWGSPVGCDQMRQLWAGYSLDTRPVITAQWPEQSLGCLEFRLGHSPERWPWLKRPGYPADIVGIRTILIPGRRLDLVP